MLSGYYVLNAIHKSNVISMNNTVARATPLDTEVYSQISVLSFTSRLMLSKFLD